MAGGGDGGRAAGGPHDGGDGGAGGQCCCWAPRVDWRTHSRSRGRAGGRRGALVAGTLPEVGLQQRKEMVKVSLVMSGYKLQPSVENSAETEGGEGEGGTQYMAFT